jgi:hypothetical protein
MRQTLFVVVMVAAAFLGGALVNGPGLRWVQARLLDYLGLQDGGEITSIELPQPASNAAELGQEAPSPAGAQPGAQRPVSTSSSQLAKNGQPRLGQKSSTQPTHRTAPELASSQVPSASPSPPTRPLPLPALVPEPAASQLPDLRGKPKQSLKKLSVRETPGTPENQIKKLGDKGTPTVQRQENQTPEPIPAPLDPEVGTALLASRSPVGLAPGPVEPAKPEPIPLESGLERLPSQTLTAAGTVRERSSAPSAPEAAWVALRKKLQALGVTHYAIEGEPGGQVSFWCLIPLAGRQAVSQRFEGKGDDEFHAAQAAIRRIMLWQAARSLASGAEAR